MAVNCNHILISVGPLLLQKKINQHYPNHKFAALCDYPVPSEMTRKYDPKFAYKVNSILKTNQNSNAHTKYNTINNE